MSRKRLDYCLLDEQAGLVGRGAVPPDADGLRAELSRRELVPAVWLPGFEQRHERERARWRLFLVRKRSSLKHRVHAQPLAFGLLLRCATAAKHSHPS